MLYFARMHCPWFGLCKKYFDLYFTDMPSHVTEKQLMIQIAELVPKHHGRTKKQESALSSSAGGSSKNTKGGKKKK